jgi:hypothetical protein
MEKEKRLDIRLSKKERKALESIARQEGMNLSAAARLAIREAAQRRGIGPVGFIVEQPTQELGRIEIEDSPFDF